MLENQENQGNSISLHSKQVESLYYQGLGLVEKEFEFFEELGWQVTKVVANVEGVVVVEGYMVMVVAYFHMVQILTNLVSMVVGVVEVTFSRACVDTILVVEEVHQDNENYYNKKDIFLPSVVKTAMVFLGQQNTVAQFSHYSLHKKL